MPFPTEYGVAATFRIPIVKRAVVDFAVGADWTPAAGDVKISIDGGAAANVATLPTAVAMGNTAYWSFPASAAEVTGRKMLVTVADSATKAVEDQAFVVFTHSHPSAEEPRNVKRGRATAGGVAAQALTMAAEAAPGLDFFGGDVVEIISATTGAGQFMAVATSTNANPPVLTMARAWPVALTGTVVYRIHGGAGAPSTVAEMTAAIEAAADADPLSVNITEVGQSSAAVINLLAFFDGTGYAGTNNVIPTVTTVTTATNVTTVNALAANTITAASIATGAITAAKFAAGAIDAAAIANGAIDAATFAADVDAEVLSYLVDDATRIDASALNTAAVTSVPAILVDTGTTLDAMLTTLIAGDVSYKKNVAVTAFEFFMRADDGTPGTGATVTASISKDGGAFAGVAGAVTELSLGWYKVDLAQAEMNADEVGLNFAATGHATTAVKIRTQS